MVFCLDGRLFLPFKMSFPFLIIIIKTDQRNALNKAYLFVSYCHLLSAYLKKKKRQWKFLHIVYAKQIDNLQEYTIELHFKGFEGLGKADYIWSNGP